MQLKKHTEDFVVNEISTIEPQNKGEYTYFKLCKTNRTTESVIQELCQIFRRPRKHFGYAGNKDKRAVTEQLCSVKGTINHVKKNDFRIELVGYGDKPVSLGDLKENHFKIIARNTKKTPKTLPEILNYFGEQRFGMNHDNHIIGLHIIRGEFQKAAEKLNELSVEKYLEQHPNDYVGALRTIPKKILRLYIHSYQSYLWNITLSKYQKKGDIPLVGFGTEFKDKKIEKITTHLMEEDNVTKRDFIVREIPMLSSSGTTRTSYAKLKNLRITKVKENYQIEFSLAPGSYATIALDQIFGGNKVPPLSFENSS